MDNNQKALSHFGVVGMRWGIRRGSSEGGVYSSRRTKKMVKKASIAKESAKEWDEIAKNQAAKGKTKAALKSQARAQKDRTDSKVLSDRAKRSQTVDDIRKNSVKSVSLGKDYISAMMNPSGAGLSTRMSLAQLKAKNNTGKTRMTNENRAQKFLDKWITGEGMAERREASKYIYR